MPDVTLYLIDSTVAGNTANGENGGGDAVRIVQTNPFGFYRLTNVAPDAAYTIDCDGKRNIFSAKNILVEESVEYLNFQAVN